MLKLKAAGTALGGLTQAVPGTCKVFETVTGKRVVLTIASPIRVSNTALIVASFWINEQGVALVESRAGIVILGKVAGGVIALLVVNVAVTRLPLTVIVQAGVLGVCVIADANGGTTCGGSASVMVITVPCGMVPVVPTMLGISV